MISISQGKSSDRKISLRPLFQRTCEKGNSGNGLRVYRARGVAVNTRRVFFWYFSDTFFVSETLLAGNQNITAGRPFVGGHECPLRSPTKSPGRSPYTPLFTSELDHQHHASHGPFSLCIAATLKSETTAKPSKKPSGASTRIALFP